MGPRILVAIVRDQYIDLYLHFIRDSDYNCFRLKTIFTDYGKCFLALFTTVSFWLFFFSFSYYCFFCFFLFFFHMACMARWLAWLSGSHCVLTQSNHFSAANAQWYSVLGSRLWMLHLYSILNLATYKFFLKNCHRIFFP